MKNRRVTTLFSIVLAVLAAHCPVSAEAASVDYAPHNTEWNGLSDFVGMAERIGLRLQHTTEIDFDKLDLDTAVFFCYPNNPFPAGEIKNFLAAGGFVIIADDFGTSEALLKEIEIARFPASFLSLDEFYRGKPALPHAFPTRADHPLAAGVDHLTTNHPAYFFSRFKPVFTFLKAKTLFRQNQMAVVLVLAVGEGTLVLISDASLFINLMLQFPGNRTFVRNLLQELMASEKTRLKMLTQHFVVTGHFTAPKKRKPEREKTFLREIAAALQTAFKEWNKYLLDLEYILPVAVLLCGFILALLASGMPLLSFRYEGQWTRAGGPPGLGPFRQRMKRHADPQNKDYTEPACLLRDHLDAELERRLGTASPLLLLTGRWLCRLVWMRFGNEAARLCRQLQPYLHRLPPTHKLAEGHPVRGVSFKRLARMEDQVQQLLGEMDRHAARRDRRGR
jgi:hypothetical protein